VSRARSSRDGGLVRCGTGRVAGRYENEEAPAGGATVFPRGNLYALPYTPITDHPDLAPLFGAMSSEVAAAVLARLRDADEGIRRLARALGPADEHDYEHSSSDRLSLHTTYSPEIDGFLSSVSAIDNGDGTVSRAATDFCFGIDAVPSTGDEPRRWHVEISAAVTCDRRRCPDEPHDLLCMSGEATSPIDAADLLATQIDQLNDWVRNQPDAGWKIFRHSDT
jgi:hypothetical protein